MKGVPEFENCPVPRQPLGQLLLQKGAVPSQYVLQPRSLRVLDESGFGDAEM